MGDNISYFGALYDCSSPDGLASRTERMYKERERRYSCSDHISTRLGSVFGLKEYLKQGCSLSLMR